MMSVVYMVANAYDLCSLLCIFGHLLYLCVDVGHISEDGDKGKQFEGEKGVIEITMGRMERKREQ